MKSEECREKYEQRTGETGFAMLEEEVANGETWPLGSSRVVFFANRWGGIEEGLRGERTDELSVLIVAAAVPDDGGQSGGCD